MLLNNLRGRCRPKVGHDLEELERLSQAKGGELRGKVLYRGD